MVISWQKPSDIDLVEETMILILIVKDHVYEIREAFYNNEFQDYNGNKIEIQAWSSYPDYPSWLE